MQTILLIAIFSLVLSVISSIISGGSFNSTQLTEQRKTETHQFMESVQKVALNDITLSYMHGNPNGSVTPENYIQNLSEIKRLANGRLNNPAVDAWGHVIMGKIITEYQPLTASTDVDNKVIVPVTGFLLVSGGPDGVIQTTIPAITTLAQIYSVVVPTDVNGVVQNDDIIYSFDNRSIQQQALESIKSRLNRIGAAALKELQARISAYRDVKLTQYQADIKAGKAGDLTLLDSTSDPNMPQFLALDTTTQGLQNRHLLGVDEDFNILENPLASGGHFNLSAPAPGASQPLVIGITNDSTKPTPWGSPPSSFHYQVKVSLSSS